MAQARVLPLYKAAQVTYVSDKSSAFSGQPTAFTSSTVFFDARFALDLTSSLGGMLDRFVRSGRAIENTAAPYEYSRLPDEKSFRLVQLFPARKGRGSPIKIGFHIANLEKRPVFDSLSYRWGDIEKGNEVFVEPGRRTLHVTANLHDFLLDLGEECPRRLFWVDQLCINHADNNEKSRLVSMIPSICMRAERMICWVGKPLPPSVPRLIRRAQQPREASTENANLITDPDPYHSNHKVTAGKLDHYQAMQLFEDEADLEALNDYLDLPYFRRYVAQYQLLVNT